MIQQTALETVKDLMEFIKDVKPLFTEKNIEKAIAGIAEAKDVIAEKNKVLDALEASETLNKSFEKREAALVKKEAELEKKKAELADEKSQAVFMVADFEKREKQILDTEAKLKKDTELFAEKDAKLTKALSEAVQKNLDADAAKKEFSELRVQYAEKLKKLSEV